MAMKYYGKEKCRILKEIRAEIARQNDIEWVVSECRHQGNCKGTCPKCEQEVRELESALARRQALGKAVAVVGISASIALSVTGCDDLLATGGTPLPDSQVTTDHDTHAGVVDGEMRPPESESESEPEVVPMGEVYLPDETEEVPLPGEEPDETEDAETGEPLMGDVPQ